MPRASIKTLKPKGVTTFTVLKALTDKSKSSIESTSSTSSGGTPIGLLLALTYVTSSTSTNTYVSGKAPSATTINY